MKWFLSIMWGWPTAIAAIRPGSSVLGSFLLQMEQAFSDALMINEEMLKILKPGTPAEEPYLLAVKIAEELGYKEAFSGL